MMQIRDKAEGERFLRMALAILPEAADMQEAVAAACLAMESPLPNPLGVALEPATQGSSSMMTVDQQKRYARLFAFSMDRLGDVAKAHVATRLAMESPAPMPPATPPKTTTFNRALLAALADPEVNDLGEARLVAQVLTAATPEDVALATSPPPKPPVDVRPALAILDAGIARLRKERAGCRFFKESDHE